MPLHAGMITNRTNHDTNRPRYMMLKWFKFGDYGNRQSSIANQHSTIDRSRLAISITEHVAHF